MMSYRTACFVSMLASSIVCCHGATLINPARHGTPRSSHPPHPPQSDVGANDATATMQNVDAHHHNTTHNSDNVHTTTTTITPPRPHVHRSGIDVLCGGTLGEDCVYEDMYHDATVDGRRIMYIKDTTPISFTHNARNSVQYTDTGLGTAVLWNETPSNWNVTQHTGTIRARIDGDLNWDYGWVASIPSSSTCPGTGGTTWGPQAPPAYADGTSVTLASLRYPDGSPVVGSVGTTTPINFSDPLTRGHVYYRGVTDLYGDEWHRFTYGDDDSAWRAKVECTEFGDRFASDGGVQDVVVNPTTPVLSLSLAPGSSHPTTTTTPSPPPPSGGPAQWYTTPARVYFIPRVYDQRTYLTDGVLMTLTNIMSTAPIFYRFNTTGTWTQYDSSTPLSSDALPTGTTLMQFYYNPHHIRNRTLVKNPDHPSKSEDHGTLWWRDAAERARMLPVNGSGLSPERASILDTLRKNIGLSHTTMDATFGRSLRAGSPSLADAILGLVDGWTTEDRHGYYAKRSLLDSVMDIDQAGNELYDQVALPSKEIELYGYYEVNRAIAFAGVYDIVAAQYRSDQVEVGGLTPIEDVKVRDVLARRVHQSLGDLTGLYNQMYCEEWQNKSEASGVCINPVNNTMVDPSPQVGMWSCARMAGALAALFALPTYNTPYYGTAGLDGTPARFPWTPARTPATWLDMLVTRHEGDYFATNGALQPFPSQRVAFNQLEGGLVTGADDAWGAGNWYDRAGYFGYELMGHTMQAIAHLLAAKLDLHMPLLETAFNRSLNGLLRPHKYPTEYSHEYYPSVLLINGRFPQLAPQALRNLNDTHFQQTHNITGDNANLGKALYGAGELAAIWYDPDFSAHPQPQAECGDGKVTGREPCDGSDFGRLGHGTAVPCTALGPLWLRGTLVCHDCRIVTDGCTAEPLTTPVAGGIE
eukprot:m.55453 g.55453  ORF g.55453 m.55453 type:complete len:924 (-) comp7605_c0_seq2:188-2959(-)